jgi:hypothetical protein
MVLGQALGYYEAESELDDFYAGGTLPDARGLKHFPRLWYVCFQPWDLCILAPTHPNVALLHVCRLMLHNDFDQQWTEWWQLCRCKDGEYSTLGQLFFTPLMQQVRL